MTERYITDFLNIAIVKNGKYQSILKSDANMNVRVMVTEVTIYEQKQLINCLCHLTGAEDVKFFDKLILEHFN